MDFFNIPNDEESSDFNLRTNDRAKNTNFSKSLIGGYTKGSVERYMEEMKLNARQMQENIEFQLQELILEKQSLSQENTLLKSQINDAEMRSQELDTEMSHALALSSEQEDKYMKQQEELLLEISDLQSKLEQTRLDRLNVDQTLESLKDDLQIVMLENDSLKEMINNTQTSNPDQELLIENLSNQIISLEGKVYDESKQYENYEILLQTKNEELSSLICDIDQLKDEIDGLKQNEQASEDTINTLESALEESNEAIDDLKSTIKNLEEENRKFSENTKFQESENDRLEKTLGHLQAKIEELDHSKREEAFYLNDSSERMRSTFKEPAQRNLLPISDSYEDNFSVKRLKEENMQLREELKQEILDKFRIEKCLSDDLRRLNSKTNALMSERDQLRGQYENFADTSQARYNAEIERQLMIEEKKKIERQKAFEISKEIEAIQLRKKKLKDSIESIEEEESKLRYLLGK